MKFLVINGPNLNMLGKREQDVYGNKTLEDIEEYTAKRVQELEAKASIDWFQSNSEAEIIEKIHEVKDSNYQALIINPAAYSHTSIAILDALNIIDIPVIEVHISNTNRREEFRQRKITAKSSTGVIEGLGYKVYALAIISQILKEG